jgi:ubiquinone/menaquinone biosynthesis C-methylase UbiE
MFVTLVNQSYRYETGMDVKEAIQQQFGPVATLYATSAVHASGPDLHAMLQAAPLPTTTVLDVGCGAGHTALAFASHADIVAAIDLTEPMLAQVQRLAAERGITNIETRRADVEDLPFADASFAVVTSRYGAHHYGNPQQALAEIARVLEPGGTFLLVDVVSPPDAAQDAFLHQIEVLRDPSHVRDHTVDQWCAMIEQAGLRAELLETWPLYLDFAAWVRRMQTPANTVAHIKRLFDQAPFPVRQAFAVAQDYSFIVSVALLRAKKP